MTTSDEALDSREWRAMPRTARDEPIDCATAFSRISAEDKLTIVTALQARGEVVAM